MSNIRYVCRCKGWCCLTPRRLLLACFLICFLSMIFMYRWTDIKHVIRVASNQTFEQGYLVKTNVCRIPELDPFDPAIVTYLSVSLWTPCESRRSLTYQDGDVLRLNLTLVDHYHKNKFNICQYYPIIRDSVNDNSYHILKVGIKFSKHIRVKHEFLKVLCFDTDKEVIYTNYHAFVLHPNITQPKRLKKDDNIPQVLRKTTVRLKTPSLNETTLPTILTTILPTTQRPVPEVKVKMNVLMVGIDSMSRLNFMRQMSRTRSYLLENLGAFDMSGYNKVADNTLVNLVPILTGRYLEDLPWNETLRNLPFDKYKFMWKHYKENGFATLFAEDAPGIATFNYFKAGFFKQPADHYYRPFALAIESDSKVWIDSHCIGDRMETEMVLQYIYNFARVYKDDKYFGLGFISRLTHDNINMAGRADLIYMKFFEKLHKENLLKNTLVFFFSDHGIRFGELRKTYIGKMEERLPFMFIVPPPWFAKRYPQILANLKVNSHRLTTPFDIHDTLIASLDIDTTAKQIEKQTANGTPTKKQRSYSLFTRVPYERTCSDASILTHWCACHQLTTVDVKDAKVVRAAEDLVKKLNKILVPEKKNCAVLKLNRIVDASIIGANDKVLRLTASVNDVIDRHLQFGNQPEVTTIDYQMTIETTPGQAHFEVSIRHKPLTDDYLLLGDISRINKYGNQADCINNSKLKKYCYCPKV